MSRQFKSSGNNSNCDWAICCEHKICIYWFFGERVGYRSSLNILVFWREGWPPFVYAAIYGRATRSLNATELKP